MREASGSEPGRSESGGVRLLVVENLDVVRRGLELLPQLRPDAVAEVVAVADGASIDRSGPPPDVVVLDYWLGRESESSLPLVAGLRTWGARVVLYTTEERPHPLRLALAAGVDAICLKNDGVDALVDTLAEVAAGRAVLGSATARSLVEDSALLARLTETETEVLQMLRYGLTHEQIAAHRRGSVKTVRSHVDNIRDKYAANLGFSPNGPRLVYEGHRDGYLDDRLPGSPARGSDRGPGPGGPSR